MVRYIFLIIVFHLLVVGLVTSDVLVDKYLGCYRNCSNQSLGSQNSVNQPMTIDLCITACKGYNLSFAGLKQGNQCLCGEDFNELVSEINCTKECSGNNSQYCGGTNEQSIAVYSVCSIGYFGVGCDKVCHCNQQAPCQRMTGKCPTGCDNSWVGQVCDTANASPDKSEWYVGCYADGNPPAMDIKNPAGNSVNQGNPTKFCLSTCAHFNYTYMGSQYYYDCNCGESNICSRYGPSSNCTYSCRGNTSQICGGWFANSVYSVCPTGSFSLNCLRRCNCLNDTRCIYRNGTCPAGCKLGWTGDSCSLRDCSVANGGCIGPNELCETIDLKYTTSTRCGCNMGYIRDKPWTNCTDVDECLDMDSFCGSDAYNCTNTIGSFVCGYCPRGQIVQNGSCFDRQTTTAKREPKSNTGLIVGVVLGIFFTLVIVAIAGIIFYRRKSKKGQQTVEHSSNSKTTFAPKIAKGNIQEQNFVDENNYEKESTYVNCIPGQSRINVDSLVEVVKHLNENPGTIQKEFKSVTDNHESTTEVGKRKEFKRKNRFKNIIPYDNNRVILSKSGSQDQTDYINASYIKGYRESDNLIASQGPTPESTDDFWRMILEKCVSVIAMITNLTESGKKKCEKYWPDTGEVLVFGEVTVSSVSEEKWHDFIKRSFLAKRDSVKLSVTQWHYTEWPDHGVPQNVRSFLAFRRKVRDSMTAGSFAVIHCSAGAGRTGSFLAIDYLLEESKTGYVDVLNCFQKLRQQRTQMIQTLEQYKFVYNALADQLRTGETALKRDDYEKLLNELQTKDPVSGKTKLENQFQTLDQQKRADTESSKYEALEVQGTRPHVRYIVKSISSTEEPGEIWKLQSFNKSKLIILVNENQDEVSFIPTEDKPLDLSQISLTLDSSTEEKYVTVYRIELTPQSVYANETEASAAQTVTLLNVHATLSPNRDAADYESLSNAYSAMKKHSKAHSDPVIIVSLNDERLSGFSVAVFNAFDMITEENEVDVYQIVHDLRMSNLSFIPTLNAYEELHNVIKHFIESTV